METNSLKDFIKGIGKACISCVQSPRKDGLTTAEREANKNKILDILHDIERRRPNVWSVSSKLKTTNFFEIGCHSHHRYSGGLAEHSLGVYEIAMRNRCFSDADSVAICALLHDVGDIENGEGDKSVDILKMWGFSLKPAEERAIKFHMDRSYGDEKGFEQARKEDLWKLVVLGDNLNAGRWELPRVLELAGKVAILPVFETIYRNYRHH